MRTPIRPQELPALRPPVVSMEHDASRLASGHDCDLVLEEDRQPQRIDIKNDRASPRSATNKIKLSTCPTCMESP